VGGFPFDFAASKLNGPACTHISPSHENNQQKQNNIIVLIQGE